MKRKVEQELKPVERHKHQCRICKRKFSCGQELDEHMQRHQLNIRETTTIEPLCISEFLLRNSNFEWGSCSSVVAAAEGGEPVDRSPPPLQWRAEEEDVAHCLLELSNSGTQRATVPKQNLHAPRKLIPCGFCDKEFPSHQALGGHRATHKTVKGCYAASLEIRSSHTNNKPIEHQNNNVYNQNNIVRSSPKNIALSIVPLAENPLHCSLPPMKNPKSYICKKCNRQFQNGQALGGHMRCHQNALKLTNTTINIVATASSTATNVAAATVNSTITTIAAASSPASAAASAPASTAASATTTTFASAFAAASVATSPATITLASPAASAATSAATFATASASATTFAAEAGIGANSNGVNAIEPCGPTLPLLFKSSYLNIDLNVPAEPIDDDDMDGSSLQLWYSDVKSPQHGRDMERRRKKNLGDLRTLDDEDGNTPCLQLRIGSMSDGEGEHESEGQKNQDREAN